MPAELIVPFALCMAIVGVLVIGVSKSGFGGGVGIAAVPLFTLAFGVSRGNAILLPILIVADIFSVLHHWRKWDNRLLKILLPGSLLGITFGFLLILALGVKPHQAAPLKDRTSAMLGLIMGIICVLYVMADTARRRYAAHWQFKPTWVQGTIAGTAVGFFSMLAHAAGPVAAVFLLGQNLARDAFLSTTVLFFFLVNSIKLIPYAYLSLDMHALYLAVWLMPIVPIGTFVGTRLSRRLPEESFRQIILLLVFLTGIYLVLESAVMLMPQGKVS